MKNKLLLSVLIVLAIFVIGFVVFDLNKMSGGNSSFDENNNATTTVDIDLSGNNQNEGYTVEQIPVETNKDYSAVLSRKPIYSSDFPQDAILIMNEKFEQGVNILKMEPNNVAVWIDMGTNYRNIGDYEGAKIFWNIAGEVNPQNSVSFLNLANLYGYYLDNPDLAEKNFNIALKNAPSDADIYYKMAMFYVEIVEDNTKAINILKQGLVNIPDDPQLIETLNTLQ